MSIKILQGNCLETLSSLEEKSVNTCVTSPPYWGLRDYGTGEWVGGDPDCNHEGTVLGNNRNFVDKEGRGSNNKSISSGDCYKCSATKKDDQLGLEETPEKFVESLVNLFREVRRVLRDDGTVWLNLGDSYLSNKQLGGIPWRVAFALKSDGWYLRQDIIWSKPNPMPESVTDRCTKAHEYIFLLSKSPKYYYDNEAIKYGPEGSNKRSVWSVSPIPYKEAHFATYPPELIKPCILAGCPEGGTVLDPFGGSGTTAQVASNLNRNAILCELNPEYVEIAKGRLHDSLGMFLDMTVEIPLN